MNCPYCGIETSGMLPSITALGTNVFPCAYCSESGLPNISSSVNISLAKLDSLHHIKYNLARIASTLEEFLTIYKDRR